MKNSLSIVFQSHICLQQVALPSPMLFNYYIKDLIDDLNQQTNTREN